MRARRPDQGPRNLVAITGTPGTGKKTVAPLVAEALGTGCVGLSELAMEHGLVDPSNDETDVLGLSRIVGSRVKGPSVVFGHLVPYVVPGPRLKLAAVLRCEPSELRDRLKSRGYPWPKVSLNVEAELIGLIAADAFGSFGRARTAEFDSTAVAPSEVARQIVAATHRPRAKGRRIDWIPSYGSALKLRGLVSGFTS